MGHAGVGWIIRGWVGHAGKGWFIQAWGGSSRDVVGNAGVGGSCWVGVVWGWGGYVGVMWGGSCRVGSGGSYRGGMGWVMKNIKILKILNYWCYRVSNQANQKICRVLNFLIILSVTCHDLSEFLCKLHSTFYE